MVPNNLNLFGDVSLTGVAITAAVEPDGRLRPIGSGFEKLLAAARERSLPRVHTVVVADGQDISALGFVADRHAKILRDPGSEFCVVKAATLNEAARLLAEDLRTRWGAIIDCSGELDRHANFVGRAWLMRQVETFLAEKKSGYLLVTGQPGVGKSAFIASLVRERSQTAIYHFLIRQGKWNESEEAIRSLSAQLRCRFAVPEADDDRRLSPTQAFPSLLQRVSKQLAPGQQAVVCLDGLDEMVDPTGRPLRTALPGVLPSHLPDGVFFILTSRPGKHLNWLADQALCTHLLLDAVSPDNRADLRAYLEDRNRADHLGLDGDFLDRLADAAEGCFAVASRYLLNWQDLEAWRQDPGRIPRGLTDWLTREWERLDTAAQQEGLDEEIIKTVLGLMTAAAEPLSYNHVFAFLRLCEGGRVGIVPVSKLLEQLGKVLRLAEAFFDSLDRQLGVAALYRFFHGSFADFIWDKLSDDEKQDSHRLLAEGCGKWQELAGETRLYALRHLVSHLLAAKQWDGVEKRLCDLDFLEAKCVAGLVFALAMDFSQAVACLPPDRAQVRILRLLEEALRREIHFIARHSQDYPQALFQCLWNLCWWYDCPEAAGHYDPPEGGSSPEGPPWERSGRTLSSLLESWRAAKAEQTTGLVWLRSLRPPTVHLGTAQRAVFRGHESDVACVVYSADGQHIVSGSKDGTVRIWDSHSGAERACFRVNKHGVESLAISQDGRRIACGSGSRVIHIWDLTTGAEVGRLDGHDHLPPGTLDGVTSVAISSDGRRIASGGWDDTVRVWDANSGTEIVCLRAHDRVVRSVAFFPNGQRLISLGGKVLVWDARRYTLIGSPMEKLRYLSCIALSPDGNYIVSGDYGGTVCIWDAESGERLARLTSRQTEGVHSVALSPDGRRVVSAQGHLDNTIRLWDAINGTELACLRGHEQNSSGLGGIESVAFSPDGKHIVSGGQDGTVRVWDATGSVNLSRLDGHTDAITCIAFSPSGQRAVSGSAVDDTTVRVWDTASGVQLLVMKGLAFSPDEQGFSPCSCVERVAFFPDGQRIASCSTDGIIDIWDAASGNQLNCIRGQKNRVQQDMTISPNRQRVVRGSTDKPFVVWDSESREFLEISSVALPLRCHAMEHKLETVIEAVITGESVAYWPIDLHEITTHPSGRIWAAAAGNYLCLLKLEGDAQAHLM